jgi:hypothetical protein
MTFYFFIKQICKQWFGTAWRLAESDAFLRRANIRAQRIAAGKNVERHRYDAVNS